MMLLRPAAPLTVASLSSLGRVGLLLVSVAMIAAGLTILTIGMTVVFVPQDLDFMGLQPADLTAINPRLIPLIAHDRAGFGGAILATGLTILGILWCGRPTPSLWQALVIAGGAGFGAAIGIHIFVGYIDFVHLAPAILGAVMYIGAMVLCYKPVFANN